MPHATSRCRGPKFGAKKRSWCVMVLLYANVRMKNPRTSYHQGAERYAAANPDDPDAAEIVRRQRAARDTYLRWGRDTLGWAVYLFRSDG